MKLTLLILNILALIASIIWLVLKPDWEPLVTTIGCIGGLIAQYFTNSDNNSKDNVKMTQKSGKNSKNYQSYGDITINKNDKQ
jgi:hypothetical protein